MDFKFHSMEVRTSNYLSPSHNLPNSNNFSCFTQQSIQEQNRREIQRNPSEVWDLQRELEKERIRAEIIAEEIVRRRILEEEVRREMMLERELALRRGEEIGFGSSSGSMWFEPRFPLLANLEHRVGVSPHREVGFRGFETLPFQRDPGVVDNVNVNVVNKNVGRNSSGVSFEEIKRPSPEVKKDKVIILAKPNEINLKRKATAPVEHSSSELKKPKIKEEWSCALCRVSATSKRGLNDHLQGKKHKARERGMVAQRTGFGTSPLPKKSSSPTGKPIKVPGIHYTPSLRKKDEKADGDFSLGKVNDALVEKPSGTDDNSTLLQEKEASVEKKENKESAMAQKTQASPKPKKFRYFCEICKVGAYSPKVMSTHNKGKRHLMKVLVLNNIDVAPSVKTSAVKDAVEEKEDPGMAAEEPKNGIEGEVKVLEIDGGLNVAAKDDENQVLASNDANC